MIVTITYCVAPLRRRYFDESNFVFDLAHRRVEWIDEPSLRHIPDISAWLEWFNARHINELDEPITWDERSTFCKIEDFPNHGQVLLRYAAAVFALGIDHAALAVESHDYAALSETNVFETSTPRFRQILQCDDYWLPTQSDVVVRGDDWRGKPQSFGSSFRLLGELEEVSSFLVGVDPSLRSIGSDVRRPRRGNTLLEYAWLTSRVMSEFCLTAVEQRLPFWVGGR